MPDANFPEKDGNRKAQMSGCTGPLLIVAKNYPKNNEKPSVSVIRAIITDLTDTVTQKSRAVVMCLLMFQGILARIRTVT